MTKPDPENRRPWRIIIPVVAVIAGGALSVIYTGSLFGACKTILLSTVTSGGG